MRLTSIFAMEYIIRIFVAFEVSTCFGQASESLWHKYIQKKREFSNYDIVRNATFKRQTVRHLILCARFCADHQECVSFSYSKTNGLCSGGKILNPSLESLAASTGFMFYSLTPGSCSRTDYTYVAELRLCIKFYQVFMTQSDALSQCIQDGGHLIRITSALKQDVIANEFNISSGALGNRLWIDGTNVLANTQWRFSDGSPLMYTNFQPSDPTYTDENCVMMYKVYGFKWADILCTKILPFVCEIQTY